MANHGLSMAIIDLDTQEEPKYFSNQVAFARRFYRHGMDFEDGSGYRVVAGGTETCLPGYRVDRREFPYWAVEMVSSGRGTVYFGTKAFALKTGSVFAYAPGRPHRIVADAVYPLKKQFVDFLPSDSPPKSFSILKKLLDGTVLQGHYPESLRRSFDDLLEFGNRNSRESGIICSGLVDLLLMKIGEDTSTTELAESPSYRSYRRCIDIIDQRFLDFSTVADVADAANMDISYLCRLFKRYNDETAYRKLTKRRMNHAAGLMLREGMGVREAAIELGYEDAFTFSRRFKGVMGISPRNFAEESRASN